MRLIYFDEVDGEVSRDSRIHDANVDHVLSPQSAEPGPLSLSFESAVNLRSPAAGYELSSLGAPRISSREFFDSAIPPYAILSHRWSDDEVTLADVRKERRGKAASWNKITSALRQARSEGLEYLWVDTCCIDKSSSAELSEAINSMFQWYNKASICYAFLSDVDDSQSRTDVDEFAISAWFTRGWTLQELIAPTDVVFFDSSWSYITKRSESARQLANITGIDQRVLESNGRTVRQILDQYSVAQRMSWAAHRCTTRAEDIAYCLLGIFDVNMPMVYGEGNKAFVRLQEELLRNSADTSVFAWNSPSGVSSQLLASGVESFRDSASFTTLQTNVHSHREITPTNVSLQILAPIMIASDPRFPAERGLAMLLDTQRSDDITTIAALKLSIAMDIAGDTPEKAMRRATLSCVVGWPGSSDSSRLVFVDVIDANMNARRKAITIAREKIAPAIGSDHERDLTYVWLRFSDRRARNTWSILDVWPKQYWNRKNWTFDLKAFRADNIVKEGRNARPAGRARFGLPVSGAIALTNDSNQGFVVNFCQQTPSLKDGFWYEVKALQRLDVNLRELPPLSGPTTSVQNIGLSERSQLSVEFRTEHLNKQVFAMLALTLLSHEGSRLRIGPAR